MSSISVQDVPKMETQQNNTTAKSIKPKNEITLSCGITHTNGWTRPLRIKVNKSVRFKCFQPPL